MGNIKEFDEDFRENIDLFSVLNRVQQFLVNNILLNIEHDTKIREILKVD